MNRRNKPKSNSRKALDRTSVGFNRLDFQEFREEQPPKPLVANAGAKGQKLQQVLADFRQRLQKQRWQLQRHYNAESDQRTRRITVRSVKDAIIDRILLEKTSTLNRRQLKQLPIGELPPHLPRFDWRDQAVVSGVRDQRACNSCWAVAATQAFESNLMIQLANFATNSNDEFPDSFFVSQVALNTHSTMDCVEPFSCEVGRYETALNYYFDRGIPAHEIKLNGVPLDQSGQVQPLPGNQARDAALPPNHCDDNTSARIKIMGWDYVRRDAFKIPSEKAMKMALLEYGPLVVAMNTLGLQDFSTQQLVDYSEEIGTNPGSGVVFKRETVSGGLLVCIPTRQLEKKFVESLGVESFNLNSPIGGDQRYRFFPAAAETFKQGQHVRAASTDLNVGKFIERNANRFFDMTTGKGYQRETDTFLFHFPRSNDVRLKQDPLTDKFTLHLPANSETKVTDDTLEMITPWHPPEDLDPVFEANPDLPFNHFVLLIGWDDKKEAWIIQNSWGDDWGFTCGGSGSRGYVYVRYGTFGQYAAWLEADLLDQKLLAGQFHSA